MQTIPGPRIHPHYMQIRANRIVRDSFAKNVSHDLSRQYRRELVQEIPSYFLYTGNAAALFIRLYNIKIIIGSS